MGPFKHIRQNTLQITKKGQNTLRAPKIGVAARNGRPSPNRDTRVDAPETPNPAPDAVLVARFEML
jgi:hypothetical protein